MALRTTCVTSRTDLESLRPEWDALWTAMRHRTPFQHTSWLFPWWDVFAPGDLRIVTFRDGERLVGILPLYASSGEAGGELRLLGGGLSDYLDMLVAPAAEDELARRLPIVFEEAMPRWNFCGLDHLRPGSLLLECSVPQGGDSTTVAEEPSAVMNLPSSIAGLSELIGSKFAGNIRYCSRRAERMGTVTVEHACSDDLQDHLDALFTLHGNRWTCRGEPGVLHDRLVRTFHRTAAPGLARAGLLRITSWNVGGRVAATQYGFQVAGRAYLYIGGFDPSLSAISPGTLSIVALIERAIAEGATTLDFLGGREAYKYKWGATDRPRFSRHLRRGNGGVTCRHQAVPA